MISKNPMYIRTKTSIGILAYSNIRILIAMIFLESEITKIFPHQSYIVKGY
jgi:hypothetical protein